MSKAENALKEDLPSVLLNMGNCVFFQMMKSNDFVKKIILNRKFPQNLFNLQLLILIAFWEYKGIKFSSR